MQTAKHCGGPIKPGTLGRSLRGSTLATGQNQQLINKLIDMSLSRLHGELCIGIVVIYVILAQYRVATKLRRPLKYFRLHQFPLNCCEETGHEFIRKFTTVASGRKEQLWNSHQPVGAVDVILSFRVLVIYRAILPCTFGHPPSYSIRNLRIQGTSDIWIDLVVS